MDRRDLLIAYVIIWVVYVAGIHDCARRRRISQGIVVLSHAVPTCVAGSMIYFFLIMRSNTVVQFAVGDERAMGLWSGWSGLWPGLLFASAAAAGVHLLWSIVVTVRREFVEWWPVAASGAVMCAFACITVMSHFPSV